uniref:LIM zinc-binding domain-containing protein n=1 Tax=Setaria digitata TaxID=48799 RepID=A0A915PGQ4_9BILA
MKVKMEVGGVCRHGLCLDYGRRALDKSGGREKQDEPDAFLGMILDACALMLSKLSSSSLSSPLLLSLPSSKTTIAAENFHQFINMKRMIDLSRESPMASPKVRTFNSSSEDDCDDITVPLTLANGIHCNGCGFEIKEKYMMKVDNNCWHENCLICCTCRIPLSGSTCYSRNGQLYCKEDYIV